MFFQGYAVEVTGSEAGALLKEVDLVDVSLILHGWALGSQSLPLGQDERSLGVMAYLPWQRIYR